MLKKLIIAVVILILGMSIIFTGCHTTKKQVQTRGGLKINGWSSGLGSVNETDLDKTKFSYSMNLTNENENSIFIKSIQPTLNEKIKSKIISKDIVVPVNSELKANKTTQINGEIIVDTEGLTKADIAQLEPFIKDIKVSTEETISLRK